MGMTSEAMHMSKPKKMMPSDGRRECIGRLDSNPNAC